MKNYLKLVGGSIAGALAFCGAALAAPCGGPNLPACTVPEPSSLPLVAVAIVGAALASRFIRK